jgi:hypothetical protein
MLRVSRCPAFYHFDDSLTTVEIHAGGCVFYRTLLRRDERRSFRRALRNLPANEYGMIPEGSPVEKIRTDFSDWLREGWVENLCEIEGA